MNLKPVAERKIKQKPKVPAKKEEKSEYTQYFRGFMSGSGSLAGTGSKAQASVSFETLQLTLSALATLTDIGSYQQPYTENDTFAGFNSHQYISLKVHHYHSTTLHPFKSLTRVGLKLDKLFFFRPL